ncbi:MAG: ArsR family transcriptional regulator, partial [Archaeoglobi archaeon]|nr:ArsR family transcriptional regulator [Archaeoglobi archaeon]
KRYLMEFKCDDHLRCTLKCALDLSCVDLEVYVALLKKNPSTIEEISELIGKDKSTVYKSLQKLLEKGLAERDYRILRGGGYRYLYKPVPFREFKEQMLRAVENWSRTLMESISELEKMDKARIQKALESVL